MFYLKLKKIESTHALLRTNEVNGLAPELPEVGKSFFMYSHEVLTPGTNLRHITTSTVKDIRHNQYGEIVFRTENSVYVLTGIIRAEPGVN